MGKYLHLMSTNSSSKSEVMLNRMIHITISNIELSNQQFDKQVHWIAVATYVLSTKD